MRDKSHFPALPGAELWRGLKVGLLGGSFNPAHEGHLHISLDALKGLGLDHVWWLVSPQNPLKSAQDMAPLSDRLKAAKAQALHPRIHALALESRMGTRYTADTIARLRQVAPHTHFVWLMGADNLIQFPQWRNWSEIVRLVPLAIFDRDHYSLKGLTGKFAMRYRQHRLSVGATKAIATAKTPAWTFITLRRHPASATQIRAVGAWSHVSRIA